MIARWPEEFIHWLFATDVVWLIEYVFQAMFSPAAYHAMPWLLRMSKMFRPSGWVWLK